MCLLYRERQCFVKTIYSQRNKEQTKRRRQKEKERVAEGAQQWELWLRLFIGFLKTTFCSKTPLRYIFNFSPFFLWSKLFFGNLPLPPMAAVVFCILVPIHENPFCQICIYFNSSSFLEFNCVLPLLFSFLIKEFSDILDL